jgi:hypothetical protein
MAMRVCGGAEGISMQSALPHGYRIGRLKRQFACNKLLKESSSQQNGQKMDMYARTIDRYFLCFDKSSFSSYQTEAIVTYETGKFTK